MHPLEKPTARLQPQDGGEGQERGADDGRGDHLPPPASSRRAVVKVKNVGRTTDEETTCGINACLQQALSLSLSPSLPPSLPLSLNSGMQNEL